MVISPDNLTMNQIDLSVPVPLVSENFTSIERTPWAGCALASGIKREQAKSPSQKIGESWEVSCDPEMPSMIKSAPSFSLSQLIASRPSECLSAGVTGSGRISCDILIKLLNASSPLSLQLHPADDNISLKTNECGKPESWLVISADPGAGLYLGFSRPLSVTDLEKHLTTGTFTQDLLQFVPVKPGDYFEIEPHVPHAIGPGIVLLEPQRILQGKSGKTWRLWDWNRKYNAAGELDPVNGKPRELHIQSSLKILDPSSQCGAGYVESLRRKPRREIISQGVIAEIFPANRWYQTISLQMTAGSRIKLLPSAGYACATVTSGSLWARGQKNATISMNQGESFFMAAASLPNELAATEKDSHIMLVVPAGQGVSDHGGNIFS